jgi:hypothetical protein
MGAQPGESGYAASETGGRFGAGRVDPRKRRNQLPEGALPGHTRLARWLASIGLGGGVQR